MYKLLEQLKTYNNFLHAESLGIVTAAEADNLFLSYAHKQIETRPHRHLSADEKAFIRFQIRALGAEGRQQVRTLVAKLRDGRKTR